MHRLFGSDFSHAAFAHHVGRTTVSAAQRIQPIDEPDTPIPCYGCWALMGFGALYVIACAIRMAVSG